MTIQQIPVLLTMRAIATTIAVVLHHADAMHLTTHHAPATAAIPPVSQKTTEDVLALFGFYFSFAAVVIIQIHRTMVAV